MQRRTGKKRHRVAVQSYTVTSRSAQGDPIRSFSTVATYWAQIEPLTGREMDRGDKQEQIATHRITMRFFTPGMDASYRMVFKTRVFNIVNVINVGERSIDTVVEVQEQGTYS